MILSFALQLILSCSVGILAAPAWFSDLQEIHNAKSAIAALPKQPLLLAKQPEIIPRVELVSAGNGIHNLLEKTLDMIHFTGEKIVQKATKATDPHLTEELQRLQAQAAALVQKIHSHLDPVVEAAKTAEANAAKAVSSEEMRSALTRFFRKAQVNNMESPVVHAVQEQESLPLQSIQSETAAAVDEIESALHDIHPDPTVAAIQHHEDIIERLKEIEEKLEKSKPILERASNDLISLATESKTIIQILMELFTDIKLMVAAFVGASSAGGAMAISNAMEKASTTSLPPEPPLVTPISSSFISDAPTSFHI